MLSQVQVHSRAGIRTTLASSQSSTRDTAGRRLAHYDGTTPGRAAVEAFIRREFIAHFDARPTELMPELVALHDCDGEVSGAAGFRSAGHSKLFLETYTRQPIDETIAQRFGERVDRRHIAEVGNLATRGGRSALQMVAAMLPALIARDFTWVVFTGAQGVRNLFQRLHLLPYAICIADKTLLGDEQHAWGTYYDHNPIVMAGRLRDGMSAMHGAAAVCSGVAHNPDAQSGSAGNSAR